MMAERLVMASSAAQAASLKDERGAYLAGGTEINRLGSSVDADTLIGIGRLEELDGIAKLEDVVKIGSMSTFQDIIDSNLVPEYLKTACRFMGSRTKRNMATIGGNIALHRTDSYLYATLLCCGAKLSLMDRDGNVETRCVNCYLKHIEDLKDRLILSVSVPLNAVVESKRYANTMQSHAVLTVSASVVDGKLRLAVAAKDTALMRLDSISDMVCASELSDEQILEAVSKIPELDFRDDLFGSAKYKRYLLSVTIADLCRKVKGGRR